MEIDVKRDSANVKRKKRYSKSFWKHVAISGNILRIFSRYIFLTRVNITRFPDRDTKERKSVDCGAQVYLASANVE